MKEIEKRGVKEKKREKIKLAGKRPMENAAGRRDDLDTQIDHLWAGGGRGAKEEDKSPPKIFIILGSIGRKADRFCFI